VPDDPVLVVGLRWLVDLFEVRHPDGNLEAPREGPNHDPEAGMSLEIEVHNGDWGQPRQILLRVDSTCVGDVCVEVKDGDKWVTMRLELDQATEVIAMFRAARSNARQKKAGIDRRMRAI